MEILFIAQDFAMREFRLSYFGIIVTCWKWVCCCVAEKMFWKVTLKKTENGSFEMVLNVAHLWINTCPKWTIKHQRNSMTFYLSFHRWLWSFFALICLNNPIQHLLVQSQQWKHQSNAWNMIKNNRHQNSVNDVVLLFLLLTLNRYHTLLWCLHCWLWTNKSQLRIYPSIHPWSEKHDLSLT